MAKKKAMDDEARELGQLAANMLRQGASDEMVEDELVRLGLDERTAAALVDRIHGVLDNARKEKAQRDMAWGGIICVVGIVITAGTYSAASGGGGSYVVAWGAIIFGAIRFFRGLSQGFSRSSG
jgi:hypothetical protein